jgi:hypothetical protein
MASAFAKATAKVSVAQRCKSKAGGPFRTNKCF